MSFKFWYIVYKAREIPRGSDDKAFLEVKSRSKMTKISSKGPSKEGVLVTEFFLLVLDDESGNVDDNVDDDDEVVAVSLLEVVRGLTCKDKEDGLALTSLLVEGAAGEEVISFVLFMPTDNVRRLLFFCFCM